MHRTTWIVSTWTGFFNFLIFIANYLGDLKTADSLGDQGIHIAEMSFRPESCLKAYLLTLRLPIFWSNFEKRQKYGLKALELVKLLITLTWNGVFTKTWLNFIIG